MLTWTSGWFTEFTEKPLSISFKSFNYSKQQTTLHQTLSLQNRSQNRISTFQISKGLSEGQIKISRHKTHLSPIGYQSIRTLALFKSIPETRSAHPEPNSRQTIFKQFLQNTGGALPQYSPLINFVRSERYKIATLSLCTNKPALWIKFKVCQS